jgi:uncharacterized protein
MTIGFNLIFISAMLLIKTNIKKSEIPNAGMGLFADEFIPKGMLIWKFDPESDKIISMEEFRSMDDKEKSKIRTYGYSTIGSENIKWLMDNGKYVNHSESPNLKFISDSSYAIRDIQQGEELTEDYSDYNECDW